jgi:DNA-binding MarR family transcriptional regulator
MKRPMDRGLRAQAAAIEAARIISTNCLAIRTRRLHRSVSRVYDAALRPHGLTAPQLALLVAIALTRGVQPKILSPILDLEKSTLSRNLALLVKHGWIQANRSGRSQTVRLTATGASLLANAQPAWERAQRAAQRLLSRELVDTLRQRPGFKVEAAMHPPAAGVPTRARVRRARVDLARR